MAVQHFGLAAGTPKKPRKFRRAQINRDKWGRRYYLQIDLICGDPVGPIEPQFSAPIALPADCVTVPENQPRSIMLHYRKYIDQLRAAERDWEMQLARISEQLYGDKANVAKPTRRALKLAGPRPQSWRLVVLAAKGDPYLLGLQKEPTEGALRLMGAEARAELERAGEEAAIDIRDERELRGVRDEENDDEDQLEDERGARARSRLDDGDVDSIDLELDELDDPDGAARLAAAHQDLDQDLDEDLEEDDDLEELEHQHDPAATGGKRHPVTAGKPRHTGGRKGKRANGGVPHEEE